jgi:hypothetical protein
MRTLAWNVLAIVAIACGGGGDNLAPGTITTPSTLGSGETGSNESGGTTRDDGESSSGSSTGDDDGPVLDVAPETTGAECMPGDYCCDPDAAVVHELLDAFLAAYPPANMPITHDAVRDFAPMTADGATMTWSKGVVADEYVDPTQGGLIEENVEEGRAAARMAAELTIPAGATTLDVREDPIVIMPLQDGMIPCVGVGWGWGSIVFRDVDLSVNELAFLYIGMCWSTESETYDAEFFGYSEEAAELCAPPA